MKQNTISIRKLKAALAHRGEFQWMLAARLELSASTFSAILHGRKKPPPNFAAHVAAALKVAPATIVADAQEPKPGLGQEEVL